MSADLHIHSTILVTTEHTVLSANDRGPITNKDLRCVNSHTMGSKWFSLGRTCGRPVDDIRCVHDQRVELSDNVWIGEVSWLKRMFLDDKIYVPDMVQEIHDLIGEDMPVLDAELNGKILCTVDAGHRHGFYDTVQPGGSEEYHALLDFLARNQGQRLFTISW